MTSRSVRFTARSGKAGGPAWRIHEARGAGPTEVREFGPAVTVTAAGKDFTYDLTGGKERFKGEDLKVRIEKR
jgi:hypothetical protein